MSDFAKNYYSPKNKGKFLSLTWETGYRNVQLFDGTRLITTIEHPQQLIKGIKIEDSEFGRINLKFTTVGPKKVEIKVNRKKYVTVNKLKLGYDFSGLISVFTSLAVLVAIGLFILLGSTNFDFGIPIVAAITIIDIIIMSVYGITSYLLSKKHAWAYFVGGGLFLATTLFTTLTDSLIFTNMFSMMLLIFRYGILTYIVLQAKHIIKEIERQKSLLSSDELLDN